MDRNLLKPANELAAKRSSPLANESAAYASARQSLLASEIEARRVLTNLAEQRRALPPGPVIEKNWQFRNSEGDELSLADLFGDKNTLITYFWIYGPEREKPCPMCADTLSGLNGVARNVMKLAAFKVLGRSPVSRQLEIARKQGWSNLEFVQTLGDAYANDLGLLLEDGSEAPAFTVYQRDGHIVRVFYNSEMPMDAADPGQDPRGATDLSPLWNLLDHTPEGRGGDWRPELD
ncbi:DUF899 family protein [Agrobacterium tumefaciens]|uniref:DUF899 family protein n=1 Tax=Agrobacterium tumefaciens TaxID=358 RepID=A0AA44J9T3_AGRTU|nr:DUF899 family protein [Agrobacterium tumefaciens]NTB87537.1 DUF899 family protein [Agrobacterium tumefaciens]NTC17522.1 DUF899 family protein [Agrobacterium tumefaciens]NTC29696.1 DUF899 family protein [Agrobacterium tumefaciens]